MKKYTQIISWAIIATIMASHTFAFAMPITAVPVVDPNLPTVNATNDEYIPPVNQNNVTYDFDKNLVKTENPGLYKIVCDNAALYKRFGIENGKNFTALEYKEGDYIFRGDFRTCSLSAWKEEDTSTVDWKVNRISEKDALAKAAEFLTSNHIEDVTFKLGAPIVTSKTKDSPIMYAMDSAAPVKEDATTTKKDDGKYQSITVVYPIALGGKNLRTSWDDPVGVSITVDGRGVVTGLTATTRFTLKKKSSDVMSEAELLAYIKKGGNSAYYPSNGGAATVKLDRVEKTFVLFSYYAKGVSDQYISTGIRLESTGTKLPYNEDKNYSQIVSDYVIGNPSYTVYAK